MITDRIGLHSVLLPLLIKLFFLEVGLAVGDTEKMKKYATIKRVAMQLQYQIEFEEAYPNFLIRRAYQMVYVEKPNKLKLSKFHRFASFKVIVRLLSINAKSSITLHACPIHRHNEIRSTSQ